MSEKDKPSPNTEDLNVNQSADPQDLPTISSDPKIVRSEDSPQSPSETPTDTSDSSADDV